jgi:hypothetical protein
VNGNSRDIFKRVVKEVDLEEAYITTILQISGCAYKVSISKSNSAYVYFLVNFIHDLIDEKYYCQFWQV